MIDRRRMVRVVALLVAGSGWAAPAFAQEGRAAVREGNRLYEDGRFQEAHQRYLQGLAEAPTSGVLRFNDGNALYRSDEYAQAMEAYERAIESGDPELARAAWYNLGNALYRQQQLEQSLEAYKQALRLNPDDVDAKHNLERVLEQMQQQQEQQQEQDDQSPNEQDPDQPQDQQQDQQDQNQRQNPQSSDQQQPPEQSGRQPPQPRPGQMSPEEAERLLEAVDEDPDEVNRARAPATGPRPTRPW
jgi:Ca-activated chloride channel family protein